MHELQLHLNKINVNISPIAFCNENNQSALLSQVPQAAWETGPVEEMESNAGNIPG